MNVRRLNEALELARRVRYAYLATASATGEPHITTVENVSLHDGGSIRLTEWFCPATLRNVEQNVSVAVVIWEPAGREGFQILGRVVQCEDRGILDGYLPHEAHAPAMPQVLKAIDIQVEEVLEFRHGPHSDQE